jgi:hypothetical protein
MVKGLEVFREHFRNYADRYVLIGGTALTHFRRTLPPEGSDMAEHILCATYNFDFLSLLSGKIERPSQR